MSSSGTPGDPSLEFSDWIPAFAGMTEEQHATRNQKTITRGNSGKFNGNSTATRANVFGR